MGRITVNTVLIPALLILSFVFIFGLASAASFDVKVKYFGTIEDYYSGGEYIYLVTEIKPRTSSDSKKLDGFEYKITSGLQDCGMIVEVNLTSGKTILHPTPDDYYVRENNSTVLKFFLPDFGKTGVGYIDVKVYGYVPEIGRRLEEIPVVQVFAEEEKIAEKNLTVVNKHRFYEDIKKLKEEVCSKDDKKKLDEALSLYYDDEFKEADKKIREVEKSVAECKFKEKKRELEDEIDNLKQKLSDVRKDLTMIEVKLQLNREKLENYDALSSMYVNLSDVYKDIDRMLDKARDRLYEDEFSDAEKLIDSADAKLKELKNNVTSLMLELQAQEKSGGGFDWMWIAAIVAVISIVVVVGVAVLRNRGRGL